MQQGPGSRLPRAAAGAAVWLSYGSRRRKELPAVDLQSNPRPVTAFDAPGTGARIRIVTVWWRGQVSKFWRCFALSFYRDADLVIV